MIMKIKKDSPHGTGCIIISFIFESKERKKNKKKK